MIAQSMSGVQHAPLRVRVGQGSTHPNGNYAAENTYMVQLPQHHHKGTCNVQCAVLEERSKFTFQHP